MTTRAVPSMTPEQEARWARRLLAGRSNACEGDDDTCTSAMWKRMPDGRELCKKHVQQEGVKA